MTCNPNESPESAARGLYREALADGRSVSRTQIAKRFGRSRGWAHNRLKESLNQHRHRHHRHRNRIPALAFAIGIGASVAANVLHARLLSASSAAAWVGAAFWPIALLLALEVLTRVHWPAQSLWYTTARYGGTGLVAIVAAILSYRHMAGLLRSWGEDALSAHLGPLAVDGLMITAAAALLTTSRHSDREQGR